MNARVLCLVAFVMTACSASPEIRYYTLSAEPGPKSTATTGTRMDRAAYVIDAVTIPDLLDRPQIVLRAGPNGVDVLDDDRWAAPLPDLLQRVLAADLSSRLGAGAIIDPGLPSAEHSARRITISILEFDAARDGQSVLDASWTISDTDAGPIGRSVTTYRARHVAPTNGVETTKIVATMSRLLPALADDIAATVRGTSDPRATISDEASAPCTPHVASAGPSGSSNMDAREVTAADAR